MTTENNKLIAEFMEHKPTFEVYIDDVLTTLERPIKNYNSDWNWLMEVVEKIKSIVSLMEIPYTNQLIAGLIIVDKEAVYNACVEFIKWYNEQLKENECSTN